MKNTDTIFIQKPLSAKLAATALILLAFPFAVLTLYIAFAKIPVAGLPAVIVVSEEDVKKLIVFAFMLIVVDFILFYVFFNRICEKLTALARALRDLNEGNYPDVIPVESPDEIGVLSGCVNELSQNLHNSEIRRIYKLNAQTPVPVRLDKERRAACAMFIEIENWEGKSYLVSGKRLIALLAKFYAIVSNYVRKTEGVIDSHMDAQIFALWTDGALSGVSPGCVYHCLRCALLIRHAVYQYNKYQPNNALRIKINMGIYYGSITAGLVKVSGATELSITGGALDSARKIAACAHENNFDILISESACRAAAERIVTEDIGVETDKIDGKLYALVNIKNINRLKQPHPRTAAEVRKIMNWRMV
ncbi:MAG: hypothetical protein LBG74_02440 [Spirochaetaceae bacterium]|jgi:class 3 adenylate cyclase/HAMP domain-containing protein|nr:hypothetical protein [Spirochaetaceae bacterium]